MKKELGARTRQVLDVIYRLGEASAAEIQREVPDLPSYSAVRSVLRELEKKALIEHREKGMRYVYTPVVPKPRASRSALAHLLETFYEGSPEHAMKALLDLSRDGGYNLDYEELERLIAEARQQGR